VRIPVVMIGAGVGLGPFVGFLEERRRQSGGGGGDAWLFAGCRQRDKDWIYGREFEQFRQHDDALLTRIELATSREHERQYVQDRLKLVGADGDAALWTLITRSDTRIYVCGDAKGMARGVHDALRDMVSARMGLDAKSAEKELHNWVMQGKYRRDIWA